MKRGDRPLNERFLNLLPYHALLDNLYSTWKEGTQLIKLIQRLRLTEEPSIRQFYSLYESPFQECKKGRLPHC